jgi:hypothetical protein
MRKRNQERDRSALLAALLEYLPPEESGSAPSAQFAAGWHYPLPWEESGSAPGRHFAARSRL